MIRATNAMRTRLTPGFCERIVELGAVERIRAAARPAPDDQHLAIGQ
jgi:hypothetical protein